MKIKETDIQPQQQDSSCPETTKCISNYMKHAIVLSNNNLIRNANVLMQHKDAKIDKEHFEWIDNLLTQVESKFKLGFQF